MNTLLMAPARQPTVAGEEVLVALLRTHETTRDLPVVPDQAAAGHPECIVYELAEERRKRLLSGLHTGHVWRKFNLYVKHPSRGASRVLADACRAALHAKGGRDDQGNKVYVAGTWLKQSWVVDGERDESLPGVDGSREPGRYRTLEVVIVYEEEN